jgi:hypothetical protein
MFRRELGSPAVSACWVRKAGFGPVRWLLPNQKDDLFSTMSGDQPICVLGMHRSGTSCLTGSLEMAGVYLGDVVRDAPYNLKGNCENLRIRGLNDEVLAHNNATWQNLPGKLEWTRTHARMRDSIIEEYDRVQTRWAFKDPRTLLTLPFWLDADRSFQFIGAFRHPKLVTRSIRARNRGMAKKDAMALWLHYNSLLLDIIKVHDLPLINFDLREEAYLRQLAVVFTRLGLEAGPVSSARKFFDKSLKHQNVAFGTLPREVASVFKALKLYWERQH